MMKKRIFSVLLVLAVLLTMWPAGVFAESREGTIIDFAKFLEEVETANYQYDGKGVVVIWSPSSACMYSGSTHSCLFPSGKAPEPDGNTPQRGQEPNAQYQLFSGIKDVSISNVTFQFKPKDLKLCMNNSGWGGSFFAIDIRNAELQLLNSGDVTFQNCRFGAVIASPFGSRGTSTFIDCTFENVYNAYAIKDVYSPNLIVTSSKFTNCGGGIYLEGDTDKHTVKIEGNEFSNIDINAPENKRGTRGLIQFSGKGDYSNAQISITGNTSDETAAVIRQLNQTVTAAVLDTDALEEKNKFAGELFVSGTNIKQSNTIYVDTENGNDANPGSPTEKVKTLKQAMKLAKAGDTILVTGEIGSGFFNNNKASVIDKPIEIRGEGKTPVPVSSSVPLPENVAGQVKLANFSFDNSATIGLYGDSTAYKDLELVIEDCLFTQASGNCVYIAPVINSLTVSGCHFTAPQSTSYQKQYMIWPYQAKTITIKGNTFDGKGIVRGAVHLGDGHPEGTTAQVEENRFLNLERGVQLAFTNKATNEVAIKENKFENIALFEQSEAEPYETASVFVHELLDTKGSTTTVSYDYNELTGTSERIAYTENGILSAEELFTSFEGNTIGGKDAGTLEENWLNVFVARIGDQKFKSLKEAMEAAGKMEGDVTITLLANVDVSDPAVRTYDLSGSKLTSLTICGVGQNAELISGVDGNNIDGSEYCPVLSVTLPENASLTVENLTFPNDLLFDSPNGTVVVQNCVFHGSQSGYPQAKKISYLNNTFEFQGTADNFHTHNAYPVWYKLEDEKDFVFTGNTVIGYRGVHIETRGQADLTVDNNHFVLEDADHENKCIALQLVGKVNGNVSFCNNSVDAYMAVCLFKDLKYESGKLTVENNYLKSGCKLFGSSEWSDWSPEEGKKAADEFAEAFLNSLADDTASISQGHTKHHYVGGKCTICGRSLPSVPGIGTKLPDAASSWPDGPADSQGDFESDTTRDFVMGDVYQFRITSRNGAAPVMTVSGEGFRAELVSQEGSDYFFKVYAGTPGKSADVYVNGQKVVTVTAAVDVVSDTTAPFSVAQGGVYQFRLTAAEKPDFVAGSPSFTVQFAGQIGNDWFFKVYAVGQAGESCGFYVNGASSPVAVATIAA